MTVRARPRGFAQFEAAARQFTEVLQQSKARTAHLRLPAGGGRALEYNAETAREALEELQVHQEELAVADEELRTQLEELATSHARARLERDHYRELFELAPDGYFVTDPLGVIRDVNASGAQMLGTERRFLVGKPLAALLDAADVRTFRAAVEAIRGAPTVDIEVRFRQRGADSRWHSLRAARVQDGDAVLWMARDVHARRSAAEGPPSSLRAGEAAGSERLLELERANRDKEELLARERDLRRRLEEAHAAKDRFLAVLSHDLRAPLNAVLGWTQLLRREKLDQTARDRALATVERNARAQVRLVEELLDLSCIAADKVQLERVPTDLGELVRRAADSIALEATARGVELVVAEPDERLVVSGDRKRLEQVLSNLLSNALKFTHRRIAITLSSTAGRARIVVEDDGRGIPPELLPHVFDAFRQAADYTTAAEGLGLGLYIVRRAVEMHSGTVVAESEGTGKGARITVELPLLISGAVPRVADALPRAEALDGVRVLVVDDDDDARELMATVLRQRGALVTLAGDMASALSAFDAAEPDVVVSDIGMPGRGGLDLARELRSRPTVDLSPPTLVAVSGFAAPDEVNRALEAGFDVHLAKPFEPAELVTTIADAARSRR